MHIATRLRLFLLTSCEAGQDRPPKAIFEFQACQKALLLDYFLSLTHEERVFRFGKFTSDDTIRQWWAGVDWHRYCAVGLERNGRLVGLAELFWSSPTGWTRPELALSQQGLIVSRERNKLVQSALTMARRRGAVDVIVYGTVCESWVTEIARRFGGAIDCAAEAMLIPTEEPQPAAHARPDTKQYCVGRRESIGTIQRWGQQRTGDLT
jgi:hypothetical protein